MLIQAHVNCIFSEETRVQDKKTLHILQRVQNYSARSILRFGKSEHMTPMLYYLHSWLHLDYKLLLYSFYDHAPLYTCEMVTKYKPRRQLRSSGKCMLVVSKNRTKGYDARSFLYASATLCDNRLTEADSIAVFKGRLKSHIFNSYFS